MHLGDEKKWLKWTILAPYTIFIVYLIFIIVGEANYSKVHKDKMDQMIIDQKNRLNEEAKSGHHTEGGAQHHEEGAPAEGGEHHEGGEHK